MASAPDRPVTLAVIIGAHGVTGEVRLKLFCDGLDSLKPHKAFNAGKFTLKSAKSHKMGAIARFAEITDRNAAEAAREYGITRVTTPDANAYAGIVVAVAHEEFVEMDVMSIRNFGCQNHVLYDLKNILPADQSDLRL